MSIGHIVHLCSLIMVGNADSKGKLTRKIPSLKNEFRKNKGLSSQIILFHIAFSMLAILLVEGD